MCNSDKFGNLVSSFKHPDRWFLFAKRMDTDLGAFFISVSWLSLTWSSSREFNFRKLGGREGPKSLPFRERCESWFRSSNEVDSELSSLFDASK